MILRDFYDRNHGLQLTDTHEPGTTVAYQSDVFHGFFVDIHPPVYVLKTGQGPLLGLSNTTISYSPHLKLELIEDDFGRWLSITQYDTELARTEAPYAEDVNNDFFQWLTDEYHTEDFQETYTIHATQA